jgi:ATP-dependent DNA helicase DinG
MARLVARALATGRSALIQVGGERSHGAYRLSYLFPALSWPQPVVLCAPLLIQQQLLNQDLPRMQELEIFSKPILQGTTWPSHNWDGVLLADPLVFLLDYLKNGSKHFPPHIPVVFD